METAAVRLLDTGRLRRSERVLKQMLAVDPSCLAAHFHLARVYRRTREYERALHHGRRALELNPMERNGCLNLGLIYELMGQDNRAVFYYKRELSRNPGSAETLWNIGRLYFRKHRWLHASQYLRRCFDTGFEYEIEYTVHKLGICYDKLGDVQSYLDVYTSYVQMFPKEPWAFANLGRALLYAKNYKGAVLRLSTAKRLGNKKSVDVQLARAKKMLLKNSH